MVQMPLSLCMWYKFTSGPVRDKANMHSQLVQLNFNHKLHKHFHYICAKTWIKDYLCRLYADMLSSRMQQ
ncbi:hypothetical protein AB3S75_038922 [Citrus x aurantiifolia]